MRDLYDDDSYEFIYDYEEELDEYYFNKCKELKGTIGRGDCLLCGGKNSMIYEGNICFICTECHESVHEDIYYRWIAGEDITWEE